ARMIAKARWLPLDADERRRLAYLTRYHRGAVPEACEEGILDPRHDDVEAVTVLLGLLRAADTLDSRRLGAPRLVMSARATGRGRLVTIGGYVPDAEEAGQVFGKRK